MIKDRQWPKACFLWNSIHAHIQTYKCNGLASSPCFYVVNEFWAKISPHRLTAIAFSCHFGTFSIGITFFLLSLYEFFHSLGVLLQLFYSVINLFSKFFENQFLTVFWIDFLELVDPSFCQGSAQTSRAACRKIYLQYFVCETEQKKSKNKVQALTMTYTFMRTKILQIPIKTYFFMNTLKNKIFLIYFFSPTLRKGYCHRYFL